MLPVLRFVCHMGRQLDYNATLVERRDLTRELAIFAVRPDAVPAGEWFEPGQYLVVGLNLDTGGALAPVERPMTMASAAQERERVEFLIRRIADPDSETPLTHALWALAEGGRLHARPKPAGAFDVGHTLHAGDQRAIVCVASDTGLAPFVSFVRTLRRREPSLRLDRIALLHEARVPGELAFRQELSTMAREAGLRYLPCVASVPAGEDWKGPTGGVEDFFDAERIGELEDRLGLARDGLVPESVVIFACGLRRAIGATIERLLPRGFVPDHRRLRAILEVPEEVESSLFFEQFDAGPTFRLKDEAVAAQLRARFRRTSGAG